MEKEKEHWDEFSCGCKIKDELVGGHQLKRCKLHAAAPELLETLKKVQQWADEQNIGIPTRCGVRAAIAKAKGE